MEKHKARQEERELEMEREGEHGEEVWRSRDAHTAEDIHCESY